MKKRVGWFEILLSDAVAARAIWNKFRSGGYGKRGEELNKEEMHTDYQFVKTAYLFDR